MGIIAEKYAKALISSANANNSLKEIKSDFRLFLDTLDKNHELCFILLNWSLPFEFEKKILNEIFGKKLNPLFLRFIEIVLKRKREKELYCIYDKYCELVDDALNVMRVKVTTAFPVSLDQELLIKKIFCEKYKKEIIIEKNIDSSIIGGGILKIKDKVIDISIKNRLDNLRKELITC